MDSANKAGPTRIKTWLRRLEVDRAVSFALASRAWQIFASPLTTLLIASFFTKELQGYYYTFWSLVGLQTFAELGFQLVIVYVASHEWSALQMDSSGTPEGSPVALARLASLGRLAVTWYLGAAVVFIPAVSMAGIYFFSAKATSISWLLPWLTLVGLTGASFCVSALVAFLEGCNQVATVQRYRLLQAVTGNLVVWTLILAGAGLWVAVAASCVQFLWELYVVAFVYRRLWRSLLQIRLTLATRMSWRHDVWPLQWRVAAQAIFHYFGYQIFVPVMFYYHSAELAGQMGMTWTILTTFQTVAFTWLQTRTPRLGILIARHQYAELDHLFWRLTRISAGVLFGCVGLFCVGVAVLNQIPHPFAQKLALRMLPPLTVLVLSVGVLLVHLPRCLSLYLRAHKRDPLLQTFIVGNALLGLAIYVLGSRHGALAAGFGFTTIVAVVIVPWSIGIWSRCRREWHGQEGAATESAVATFTPPPLAASEKTIP